MSSQFHPPASKAEADPRRWVALAVLLIASFMNLIDVTIVNVAIPSMQQNLGADASQIEWVIAAYVLAFALGLLPFGRIGDIVGRTRMFLIGVAAFTAASTMPRNRSSFHGSAAPPPLRVTFGTGQPKLRSMWSARSSATSIVTASAIVAGSTP